MKSTAPTLFHFIWGLRRTGGAPEPFPLFAYLALASCALVNSPARLLLHCPAPPTGEWGRKAARLAELVPLDPPESIFGRPVTHYAHQADVARLTILNAQGGAYADLDTIFVSALPEALLAKPFVMGRQGRDGLCNAFMLAQPGSRFGRAWMAAHREHFTGGGPETPGWCVHSVQLPNSLARRMPGAIHVEPQRSFFKHLYDPAGLAALFERNDKDLDGAYSLHLWQTLSRERLAGLTPEALREAARRRASTYAVLAAQYL